MGEIWDFGENPHGARGVFYDQPGAGGSRRSVHAALSDLAINVKNFGAKGDGTTDDTTAFNAVQSYADATRKAVHIPAGTYILSAKITFAESVIITGAGRGQTILKWTSGAVTVGLETTIQTQGTDVVAIRGLTLIRGGSTVGASGTGIKVTQVHGGLVAALPGVFLEELDVKGETQNSQSWEFGYYFSEARGIICHNVHYRGSFDAATTTTMFGTGFKADGASNPVEVFIQGTSVYRAATAFDVEEVEGFILRDFSVVGCNTGVKYRTNTAGTIQPWLDIGPGHLNTYNFGMDLQDASDAALRDVLSYRMSDATVNFVHLKMNHCLYMNVSGWTLSDGNLGIGTSVGFDLFNCQHVQIGGNNWRKGTTAMRMDSACVKVTIDPQRIDLSQFTNFIINNGTLVELPASVLTMERTTTQGIATSTFTAIIWETEVESNQTDMWDALNPTRMVAPMDGWYTINYEALFASNATGTRYAELRKNTVVLSPNARSRQPGIGGGANYLTGSVGPVYMTANQYIELWVWQDAGGTLNIVSGTITLARVG